jgi:hypothetical protein
VAAAGNEGKYLTNTIEAAAKWALQNGEGAQIVRVTVPADAVKDFTPLAGGARIDGIGQAWWAPMNALKGHSAEIIASVLTPR